MIEIKQLGTPTQEELQYWMNLGFEYLYSAPHGSYHCVYLKSGNVEGEKTAMQWADDWRIKLNASEKSEKEALQKLEAALIELNALIPQAAIDKQRANDLDAQLVALGEENRRLREALQPQKKRRHWPFS